MSATISTVEMLPNRVRIPSLVWFGIGLIGLSWASVYLGITGPASGMVLPQEPNPASTGPVAATQQQSVCFGHVDVRGGVIPLYPLQSGRVTKIEANDRQEVKSGDILFRMDDRLAQDTLIEARAALKAAEAQLKAAQVIPEQQLKQTLAQKAVIKARESELTVARLKRDQAVRFEQDKLVPPETAPIAEESVRGLMAALDGEKAKLAGLEASDPQTQILRAEQDVKACQARVNKAQIGVDECLVRAPVDGTVLRMLVTPGETLGPNPRQPAVYFCPQGHRIIRAEVEQEFADSVGLNQVALVEDDTRSSKKWKGKVVEISDWYSQRRSIMLERVQLNDVRTLECIIELEQPAPALRIGQRVRVLLGAPARN